MHEEPLHPIDMSQCPVEEEVSVHYPDGTLIVRTDKEIEFNYARLQIVLNNIEGCYVYFKNEKFEILPYGTIPQWPVGLFDKNEKIVIDIVRNGILKHKSE